MFHRRQHPWLQSGVKSQRETMAKSTHTLQSGKYTLPNSSRKAPTPTFTFNGDESCAITLIRIRKYTDQRECHEFHDFLLCQQGNTHRTFKYASVKPRMGSAGASGTAAHREMERALHRRSQRGECADRIRQRSPLEYERVSSTTEID